MAITSDDIIELYPWANSLSEDAIDILIDDAYLELEADTYGIYQDKLVRLCVAHQIYMETQNNLAVNNALTSIRSEKTVNGMINFENKGKEYYQLTSYGLEFLALQNKALSCSDDVGMFVI